MFTHDLHTIGHYSRWEPFKPIPELFATVPFPASWHYFWNALPSSSIIIYLSRTDTGVWHYITLTPSFKENQPFFSLKFNCIIQCPLVAINGIEMFSPLSFSISSLIPSPLVPLSNHPHINLEHYNKFSYHFSNVSLYKLLLLKTFNKPGQWRVEMNGLKPMKGQIKGFIDI